MMQFVFVQHPTEYTCVCDLHANNPADLEVFLQRGEIRFALPAFNPFSSHSWTFVWLPSLSVSFNLRLLRDNPERTTGCCGGKMK